MINTRMSNSKIRRINNITIGRIKCSKINNSRIIGKSIKITSIIKTNISIINKIIGINRDITINSS